MKISAPAKRAECLARIDDRRGSSFSCGAAVIGSSRHLSLNSEAKHDLSLLLSRLHR